MTDDDVLAYIKTPIKVGDLIAMLNSEQAWEMSLDLSDEVLVVRND